MDIMKLYNAEQALNTCTSVIFNWNAAKSNSKHF